MEKLILVDVDGVLLNWGRGFEEYLQAHGFNRIPGKETSYDLHEIYGMAAQHATKLVKIFNESAAMGFLPPMRDSMFYVKQLHEKHGFKFHCITSMSSNRDAQELRRMNLIKLFGETTFERYTFLDIHENKREALAEYTGQGLYWVEDKVENVLDGHDVGLKGLLMHQTYNVELSHPDIRRVHSWREIHDIVTKDPRYVD